MSYGRYFVSPVGSIFEERKNGIHNKNSCFDATATVASSSVETVAAFAPDTQY